MARTTTIEWTDATWNPVTGCTKVSEGCANCYAERMAKRLRAMGVERYRRGFELTLHPGLLDRPLRWVKPRMVFVNSMSDLFHEEVPVDFIERVFQTMGLARQHIFQILTKRSARLAELATTLPWPRNVWIGVTVENRDVMARVDHLGRIPARVRFLSCEPLLGPLEEIPLRGIHWIIVGGESGPGARPMRIEWVESIRRQCGRARVPFFFKQWGGVRKDLTGRTLYGRTYDEMPTAVYERAVRG